MRDILTKARTYLMHGFAILLVIITAPAWLITLFMVMVVDILHEIADEE